MTDQIKISEVSAILKQELAGLQATIHMEEVGTVLQVSDGVVRIYGLENAEASELLQGVWLVEVAELDAFRKTDVSRIKQFFG